MVAQDDFLQEYLKKQSSVGMEKKKAADDGSDDIVRVTGHCYCAYIDSYLLVCVGQTVED